MKRILSGLAGLLLTLVLATASWAVGSVSVTIEKQSPSVHCVTYSWTGDSGTGAVPDTMASDLSGYVFLVVTNPGSTSPTAAYDIVLNDSEGVDVMGGALANRSATASEQTVPLIVGSVYGSRWIYGTLTLSISNQSVASATGTVKVYIYQER